MSVEACREGTRGDVCSGRDGLDFTSLGHGDCIEVLQLSVGRAEEAVAYYHVIETVTDGLFSIQDLDSVDLDHLELRDIVGSQASDYGTGVGRACGETDEERAECTVAVVEDGGGGDIAYGAVSACRDIDIDYVVDREGYHVVDVAHIFIDFLVVFLVGKIKPEGLDTQPDAFIVEIRRGVDDGKTLEDAYEIGDIRVGIPQKVEARL